MRLNSELDIVDAFTLFFLQTRHVIFERKVISTALIRYNLFQYPWGSVGGIIIRKLDAQNCDILYEYPPRPPQMEVDSFINHARLRVRQQYVEEERAKNPKAPVKRLIKESEYRANFALIILYPDFQIPSEDQGAENTEKDDAESKHLAGTIGMNALADYIYNKRLEFKQKITTEHYNQFLAEHAPAIQNSDPGRAEEPALEKRDMPSVTGHKQPRVPKRPMIRTQWNAAWKHIKHEYFKGGMNYRQLSKRLNDMYHIKMSEDTLAEVIRAGEAGLLDDPPQ